MPLKNKGEIVFSNVFGIMLAVATIVVITVVIVSVISPYFDKEEKGAKNYFNTFMKQVEIADGGKVGSFSLWQDSNLNEDSEGYYLVYFGSGYKFNANDIEFVSLGINENRICVCYIEENEGRCDFCENLKFPMVRKEFSGLWAILEKESIEIKLNESKNGYVVSKV
jgi:hypothetical protein